MLISHLKPPLASFHFFKRLNVFWVDLTHIYETNFIVFSNELITHNWKSKLGLWIDQVWTHFSLSLAKTNLEKKNKNKSRTGVWTYHRNLYVFRSKMLMDSLPLHIRILRFLSDYLWINRFFGNSMNCY